MLKPELAATKRSSENLFHALETESKYSASLSQEVTKLKPQTEHLSFHYAHTSSRSNEFFMKAVEKLFPKNQKHNSKKHALFLALGENVVSQEARKHFMKFLEKISSSA